MKVFRLSNIISTRRFSTLNLPAVDITNFLAGKADPEACKVAADSLKQYGSLLVKDPRVPNEFNYNFLNMMEKYFESRSARFYAGEKIPDIKPEYGYQTGATPEFIEKARPHQDFINSLPEKEKPWTPQPAPADSKWRYFWRIGDRPQGDRTFDPPHYIPDDIPDFENKMNHIGKTKMDAVETISQMIALGLNLDKNIFTDAMKGGAHLLAPTGSDLQKFGLGTIFAGFHYGSTLRLNPDFNFITIHGKSRFPGLYIWLRDGTKKAVAIPDGHFLIQAGKQLEILTGGEILCGFHEVVYTEKTKEAMEKAKAQGLSTWRVSTTLFSHVRHDVMLEPLKKFLNEETKKKYPAISAYDQLHDELKHISLA